MSNATTAAPIEINQMARHLTQAAAVTLRLEEEGITVLAALFNGRRPVLCVDGMPRGVQFGTKRRNRNGWGGTTVIDAVEFHDCQLERLRDVPGDWPGSRKPDLRSVPNG